MSSGIGMRNVEYSLLEFSGFKELSFWDYYTLSSRSKIESLFKLVELEEVITQRKEFHIIQDEKEYKRCRVQLYGKGIILRDRIKGKSIRTKKQQFCQKDEFLVAEIDAKFGGYGIVPESLEGAIVSGHYFLFQIDRKSLLPEYLEVLCRTEGFSSQVKATGSTNYAAIRPYHVLSYLVPLPPLPIQQQLVEAYHSLMKEAEGKDREAEALQSAIDEYILKKLGIDSDLKKTVQKGLNIVNFTELSIWGAEQLLHGGGFNFLKSDRFPNYPLTVLLHVNPRTDLEEDCSVSFVPMAAVSDEYGEIVEHRSKSTSESRGYTKFQEGDLIWARITPCMENGKSAVVRNLRNGLGFGSTEFHVLRPKVPELSIDFIHALLRLKLLREQGTYHFTGSAGQQRVPKQFLEELLIPLPPLSTQQDIVTEVHRMQERIKALRQAAGEAREQALDDFEQAIFV